LKVRGDEQSVTNSGKLPCAWSSNRKGPVPKRWTTCCWHHKWADDDADRSRRRDVTSGTWL